MNSVTRVAAVAQVTMGYFENTVAGKITEPWVAVFWNVQYTWQLQNGEALVTSQTT